jgi:hypothetical protein
VATPARGGWTGATRCSIASWGCGGFGAKGIDAALYSGSKCYFFAGGEYIRVTRGATGAGKVDPGYPKPISTWGWGAFGAQGIDAALCANPRAQQGPPPEGNGGSSGGGGNDDPDDGSGDGTEQE